MRGILRASLTALVAVGAVASTYLAYGRYMDRSEICGIPFDATGSKDPKEPNDPATLIMKARLH